MDFPIPAGGLLTREAVSTPAMRALWTEEVMLETWLRVEKAILEEQVSLEMIPVKPGNLLLDALKGIHIHPEQVLEQKKIVGHLMVAFLKTLRQVCGEAAEHLHVGPTTQDIMDTGMVLQMDPAHDMIQDQSAQLCLSLCTRAEEFKSTVMMGRTHQQPALPTTFGLLLSGWAWSVSEHWDRLEAARDRWRIGNLSGGVGTQSAFAELADLERARQLEQGMCKRLDLPHPPMDTHERFDRFTEPITILAGLTSSLAKMAMDLVHMAHPETGEAAVSLGAEEHSSSTMPHKQNPESLEHLAGLASLVQGYSQAMLSVRQSWHRDATRIPVFWTAIPGSFLMASRALENLGNAITNLKIHPGRMRENVCSPALLDQVATERIMIFLYRKTGKKMAFHQLLHDLCSQAREKNISLKKIAAAEPEIRGLFTDNEWEDIFDITSYTGTAEKQVDTMTGRLRDKFTV